MKLQKTMNKNLYLMVGIVCIALFLFLPFINAVPPVTTTQNFVTGYVIQIPQDNVLIVGQDYEFEFHVHNISNGVPIVSDLNCTFHLYNSSGEHQYEASVDTVSHNYDYEIFVGGGNFSIVGNYYYNILCHSPQAITDATLGGYASTIIYVTTTGYNTPEDISSVFAAMVLVLFGISCLFMVLGFKIEAPGFKIFFMLLGFVFLLGCLGFSLVVGFNSNFISQITTMNLVFVYALALILVLVLAFALIKQITSTLDMMREKKGYEVGF